MTRLAQTPVVANKRWMCLVCGWIYDESQGAPDEGIAHGTAWADIPSDWACPECGVTKDMFDMIEIS
ncbi:rubredoxin [Reinekea sp.]|uniref:rubredoxin n=1 Tax=Reinekea sp. TaxID=1970455 RepID=UPI002580F6EE|nr:rubredoxin [Reinekea sp.]